jgi:tRNA threonylcarbamoyladenosine biosynthesis protein TsaB
MVDEILTRHKLGIGELDGIAFGIGPGSFTGLRIGMGVVQGLAFGTGLPVLGVSTLRAMAVKAIQDMAIDRGSMVVALDARMAQVYCAAFSVAESGIKDTLLEECAVSPHTASERLRGRFDVAVGDGIPLIQQQGLDALRVEGNFYADARIIASLALTEFPLGKFSNILDVELNYIRTEISWKKHQRIRQSKN